MFDVVIKGGTVHGPAAELIPAIDKARAEGVDLYPHLCGSSTLTLVTLPDWLPPHELDRTREALSDRAVRARLAEHWPGELWRRATDPPGRVLKPG